MPLRAISPTTVASLSFKINFLFSNALFPSAFNHVVRKKTIKKGKEGGNRKGGREGRREGESKRQGRRGEKREEENAFFNLIYPFSSGHNLLLLPL